MIKYGCNGTREVSFKTKITYITYINNIENRDQSYVADISFRHHVINCNQVRAWSKSENQLHLCKALYEGTIWLMTFPIVAH